MSRVTPKMPVEGELTKKNDITSSDNKWTEGASSVDGTNIREEGLDRRVIQSDAWDTGIDNSGPDNFTSAYEIPVGLNLVSGVAPFAIVPAWDPSEFSGGFGGGSPKVRKRYLVGKTQGILVKCSFQAHWNTLGILTSSADSNQDRALSVLKFRLIRKNAQVSGTDTYADGDIASDEAHIALNRHFGSHWATVPYENVKAYDRRSDFYAAVTLIDVFEPNTEWPDMTDTDFTWELHYAHPKYSGSGSTGVHRLATVRNISFTARKFCR